MMILLRLFLIALMFSPTPALAEQRCKREVMHLAELKGCLVPLADGTGTVPIGSGARQALPPSPAIPATFRPYGLYTGIGSNVASTAAYVYGAPYGSWTLLFSLRPALQ